MHVGWIGTGLMGEPMARRLLGAGHRVTAHNRTAGRTGPLVELGASAAATVAEVKGEVVITMLPFPSEVMAEVLEGAAPGTVVVDCSTTAPALARTWAAQGQRRGVAVLDAPVSGGPAGAGAGTLSIMVGGDPAAFERVRPLLELMGSTVVHHGPPGSGQLAKLVNQTLVAGATLAACEAYALAVHGGLDVGRVRESVRPGVAGSPLLDYLWSRLAEGDLEPGFKLDHFTKDLGLIREAAGELPMPGTDRVAELAERVRAAHGGERGTQAMVRVADR
ncbi:NAD(P)-dependent oxidoreductase [Nonomuraea dietziae]|uniref:3-hydroxyisobutyrate dehydrogenase n=1 Tax=Nonomuraea dietziae TaxID=65515 RepID=A0A7W5V9S8_9ACTN|nr:NAD(P)-dependent oxidoreductase [Nonomuraea dietziae]MBB3727555.1 3-hydroxyisobutyrate dehydrogenase [Nonomuraea dietziae]